MTNGRKLSTLSKIVHSPTFITGVGFLAGVFATGIIHALIGGVLDKPEVVIWGIVSFLALMVALAITLIVREGQEVLGNQKEILQGLEKKFGLKAEFIRDIRHGDEANTGHSYRRAQEYIEDSEKSLIFVDSWVKSDEGYDESQSRKDYYQAIEKQIRSMLSRGQDRRSGAFYHRIIQLPPGEQLNVISQDPVYAKHLKECAKLQKHARDRIHVDRAEPFTHVHFSIIDDRYFVEVILTTSEHGLKRHGAIIFTDPEHDLIERYKDIIGNLNLTRIDESEIEITESQLQTDQ